MRRSEGTKRAVGGSGEEGGSTGKKGATEKIVGLQREKVIDGS
jgi:hypothetical protein